MKNENKVISDTAAVTPKYSVDDYVMIKEDSEPFKFLISNGHESWLELVPKKIDMIHIENDSVYSHMSIDNLVRYRINGLWFNQGEVFKITKEENPEYFL